MYPCDTDGIIAAVAHLASVCTSQPFQRVPQEERPSKGKPATREWQGTREPGPPFEHRPFGRKHIPGRADAMKCKNAPEIYIYTYIPR